MHYHLYGLNIQTDFPFSFAPPPVPAGAENTAVDLTVSLHPSPFSIDGAALPPPLFTSQVRLPSGDPFLVAHLLPQGCLLRYPSAGEFLVAESRISAYTLPQAGARNVEELLLSSVITFWLEQHGVRGLHASAAAVAGRALGFLANSGQGKSSVAAAFLAAGCPFLCDDILAVDRRSTGFMARSAYPRLRLWPAQMDALGLSANPEKAAGSGDAPGLALLPAGAGEKRSIELNSKPDNSADRFFFSGALPLGCLYLLERRPAETAGDGIHIQPLSPRDALIEMVRFSFLPRLTQAAGLQPDRMAFFSRLAREIPLRRLSYPGGTGLLPEVVAAVLSDAPS